MKHIAKDMSPGAITYRDGDFGPIQPQHSNTILQAMTWATIIHNTFVTIENRICTTIQNTKNATQSVHHRNLSKATVDMKSSCGRYDILRRLLNEAD